jgi:hypothetical protein
MHIPALLAGEILLHSHPYTAWGGAVTAQMYLPVERSRLWQQLTDYPRWVQYFPDLTYSQVIEHLKVDGRKADSVKRLYQVAKKSFLFLVAQVEAYLQVSELTNQWIQFRLESGSFQDFSADLRLQDLAEGTLLTYAVQATPSIPVPGVFIQQAIQLDLPTNMQNMRRVLCQESR